MSRFVFPFRAVLDYRKNRRDLCRQLLAQVLADEAQLIRDRKTALAAREGQLEEIRRLQRQPRFAVDAAAMRRYYAVQLAAHVRGLDERQRVVQQQVQLCREALTRADADVKVLERLEEKQRAAHIERVERRAQHEREDLWLSHRIQEAAR